MTTEKYTQGSAAEQAVAVAGARASSGTTPSMAQYLEIKTANPDSLLWYRMGDFYELFFEDAVVASAALGIVLTKRGKHQGADIPMCGVPIVRADEYLQRLIRLGYRVAVCEQLEDPAEARKRGGKSVVRRDVVRLVTPGTLTDEALLDAKTRNYLTAVHLTPDGATLALASLDISTGESEIGEASRADFAGELARLAPGEILAVDAILGDLSLAGDIARSGAATTPVPAAHFDSVSGERALKERLGVTDLGGFGAWTRAELAAAGALLKYVALTQIGKMPVMRPPRRTGAGAGLIIDAASRSSLELMRTLSGARQGSLLDAIDCTVTGAGARELAARLSSPLCDPHKIKERLDAVGALFTARRVRAGIQGELRAAPDLARAIARLAFGRGGPRDLAAVRGALDVAAGCRARLAEAVETAEARGELAAIADGLSCGPDAVRATLAAALVDDPPHLKREGGFVRAGYRPELDEARDLKDESRRVIASLEARYAADTGTKALKIRHNNILGYFIEVPQQSAKALISGPNAALFRHRQTMAGAMRFMTDELAGLEARIATAAERALAIEEEVFAELAAAVKESEQALSDVAAALAALDHTAGLAELAETRRYVRPEVDDSVLFDVQGGRHPVVEQALKIAKAADFIENDCVLGHGEDRPKNGPRKGGPTKGGPTKDSPTKDSTGDTARLWLVTGPNMAGKSTFLRQNALIVLLAQMGSFVPASRARLGAADRLFSRVGASDDLSRGRSTFMVEMIETAAILNQATERSLVILDEIGRGTATFDGLSIAWAAVEYLHNISRCRALFATHYHELTALAGRLKGVANVTMDVKEWDEEIVFLHKVRPGAADRSYGIQVAKLAGLPAEVIARAKEVLAILESADRKGQADSATLDGLPLFSDARPKTPAKSQIPPALAALDALRPDELTPREALEALYRLKALRAG